MDLNQPTPQSLICATLRAATDPDCAVVKKAEQQLRDWEAQRDFFPMLAHFATDQQLELNVRWMASVYLKNAVKRCWRRNARLELPADEKQRIRQLLLAHCAEEASAPVALQLAELTAQIARHDCPRDWPQLMPYLLERLQQSAQNEQYRLLLVMHSVLKALASRRCLADRRVFEELCGNIYEFVHKLWQELLQAALQQLAQCSGAAEQTLQRSCLAVRILRKLSIYGFGKPQQHACCLNFIEQLFESLERCLKVRYELRQNYAREQALIAVLERNVLKQLKTLCEFQELHALAFAPYVPSALDFIFSYVFHEGARLVQHESESKFRYFSIHCINLLKGIMVCADYMQPEQIVSSAIKQFFSTERLSYICEKLVTHYLLLTPSELEQWQEDAEHFAHDDAGESWKYALAPCVEALYATCFVHYQQQMTAELFKFIKRAQSLQLTAQADLKHILLKDAIYKALGLVSYQFFNELDFDSWFSGQLLQELRLQGQHMRILHRRIIWLVGEFAGVKFARHLRPLAYEACLHLLSGQQDMAVRLAAAGALRTLIGDYEFLPEAFLPYLETQFNALFAMLQDARECETKMHVLTVMSSMVDTMSDYMGNHADNLIAYLPLLWQESEQYNMLRCAIISTLQQLVKALRDIPEAMKTFLYTVIEFSTNLQQPSHIYLMEEGLTLWLCVVENSHTLNAQLLQLCQQLLPIIELSTEYLRFVLLLIQAYILLDARVFLELHGAQFVSFCARLFEDIRPEGAVLILKVYETCLKTEPSLSVQVLRPCLPHIFRQVYLNQELPTLMHMYLMVVARVLLINQALFDEVLQELQLPQAYETILDVWLAKLPLCTEADKRKLFALAFISIFNHNSIIMSERFCTIMTHIGQTLAEVMRQEDGEEQDTSDTSQSSRGRDRAQFGNYCDSLVFADEHELNSSSFCTMDDFDYKTYHYERLRQLCLKDPVHKISLDQCIQWQLQALRQQLGAEQFQRLLQTVPADTLQTFNQFVQLN